MNLRIDDTDVKNILTVFNDIEKQIPSLTDIELNTIEDSITSNLQYLNNSNTDGSIPITDLSIRMYSAVDNKRTSIPVNGMSFPPEYVFPRNPSLINYIKPKLIKDESYKEDGTDLQFDFGFTGTLNVIKTKYPPYLNKKFFNYANKTWEIPQIIFTIEGNDNVIDITPYYSNAPVNFSGAATGINDTIIYYFDGEKIITNYDFTNTEERKRVKITYSKLLNSIRVKAVVQTNLNNLSFYTPVIDQYTLLVDKQRVLN